VESVHGTVLVSSDDQRVNLGVVRAAVNRILHNGHKVFIGP
jgi:hypothetical protein